MRRSIFNSPPTCPLSPSAISTSWAETIPYPYRPNKAGLYCNNAALARRVGGGRRTNCCGLHAPCSTLPAPCSPLRARALHLVSSMATPTGIKRRRRAEGMFTRSRGKLVVVSAATIFCLYLCYRLAQPFMPALVWAVTGAVITHPLVGWIGRWIGSPSWRAAAAVTIVVAVLFSPAIGLVYFAA